MTRTRIQQRMEKYFFHNMETGISLVAYLAFLPGLNCVSRTWYYVFHAYRLYRDLGENTSENHDFNRERRKRNLGPFFIQLEDFIKKKNPHSHDFSFRETKDSKIQEGRKNRFANNYQKILSREKPYIKKIIEREIFIWGISFSNQRISRFVLE